MKVLIMGLIRLYRKVISPGLPASCRFSPTCSEYSLIAIDHYGVIKGGWMSIRRVLKCHPWHPGGFDPVP